MHTSITFFNTLTRSPERIESREESPTLNVYSCGPTVYRYVHIGNLRTFILSDLVVRAARFAGFDVRHVMNITDVGHLADEIFETGQDKMLLAAETEGKSPTEIAQYYTAAFFEDIDAVGIRRAAIYPKASEHVPQMIEVIEKLLARGHAYVVRGNVYFDVTTFDEYGKLSKNTLAALRAGHRGHPHDTDKRNPEDFLLWRKASPRRILKFDSPWGEGFPGWHIECTAMSLHYLGDTIDVHTGGQDLIFPHHEDEIAQSEGVTGKQVVKTWVHGAHLLVAGKKMAKSKLNELRAVDIRNRGIDPRAFRYLCLTARYRKQLNFTWDALEASAKSLRRARSHLENAPDDAMIDPNTLADPKAMDLSPEASEYESRFSEAILNDLDTPRALEVLHRLLDDRTIDLSEKALLARRWDEVLGLELFADANSLAQHKRGSHIDNAEVSQIEALVAEREAARQAKDFSRADKIRDDLASLGIELTDTPEGTVWKKENAR